MSETLNLLKVDPVAGAIYGQIISAMRTLLVAGEYSAGQRLPTVRALADHLKVNHNTVAQAYRQLAKEGWLTLRRRRGAVVSDRSFPRQQPENLTRFARQLRELAAKAIADGIEVKNVSRELTMLGQALVAE